MSEIVLVFPREENESQVMEYLMEHIENGENMLNGDAGLDRIKDYATWLEKVRKECTTLKSEKKVPATEFLAIRLKDNRIIGMIQIRHELNEGLEKRGGYIGYGVRPTERRKGYATQMLNLALKECKKLGIRDVLVTCDKSNLASAKVILKNKGVLENELWDEKSQKMVQRYWVKVALEGEKER